jgi:hypothetical protein
MRKRIAALVVAAMAITTIAFAGSADAATAPTTTIATMANRNVIHTGTGHAQSIHAGGHLLTAPSAPAGAASRSIRPASGTSPWVSPGVQTEYASPGSTYYCNYGDLCTMAWDPTVGLWKIFHLYDCHYYTLYYWNGQGYYYDNQSGNVWSYFFYIDGTPSVEFTVSMAGHINNPENWGPIYYIRNC